jgi:glycosyltransferase involved in cell wall biosynthesis
VTLQATIGQPVRATSGKDDQRVAFIQYGDYLETVERFRLGGDETYFAQRYSVDLVERLPQFHAHVMVLTVESRPHDVVLPSGVRCVGIAGKPYEAGAGHQILQELEAYSPTSVVVRFPNIPIIEWCLRTGRRVLPSLADSFQYSGFRPRFRFLTWKLKNLLNREAIRFVANHQLPACRDLVRIGVDPAKVLPWDWPSQSSPSDFKVKSSAAVPGQLTVMFAGKVCEAKGVGDLIHAVARINRSNVAARATIAGNGEIEKFKAMAQDLGVGDRVEFVGLVPHHQVLALMRQSDAVVVPTRHAYGEGLPMAIFDALTTRSPLVVSDHPMFVGRLDDGNSALFFHEKDSDALARRLRELAGDGSLYHRLSSQSRETWQRLRIPLLWGDLIERWLSGGDEDLDWLTRFTLKNHVYV